MNKKDLSERDICTKFITPAVVRAGWDLHLQIREEVSFTAGRVIVRGKVVKRGESKRADYILYYKPNLPLAIIEAKDNNAPVGGGMQQALLYGEALQIPFVYSSNGDGGSGKEPRYYQVNAVNRVVEAVAAKQDRILLVMATGTGKTYTALQIIWRLWKAGVKKRILFLADRERRRQLGLAGDPRILPARDPDRPSRPATSRRKVVSNPRTGTSSTRKEGSLE